MSRFQISSGSAMREQVSAPSSAHPVLLVDQDLNPVSDTSTALSRYGASDEHGEPTRVYRYSELPPRPNIGLSTSATQELIQYLIRASREHPHSLASTLLVEDDEAYASHIPVSWALERTEEHMTLGPASLELISGRRLTYVSPRQRQSKASAVPSEVVGYNGEGENEIDLESESERESIMKNRSDTVGIIMGQACSKSTILIHQSESGQLFPQRVTCSSSSSLSSHTHSLAPPASCGGTDADVVPSTAEIVNEDRKG